MGDWGGVGRLFSRQCSSARLGNDVTTSLLLQWRHEEVAHPVAERLTILEREIHFTSDGRLPVQRVKNAFASCGDVISATLLTAAGFFFFFPHHRSL